MKKLSAINKIIFIVNSIFSIGLIIGFFIPKVAPKLLVYASIFSLFVPALIIGNLLFVLYWILAGFKKQMIQPFLVLSLSIFFLPLLYKFRGKDLPSEKKETLSLMTYNVRKFNKYKWIKSDNIDAKISEFIKQDDPDIVVLQEYQATENFKLNYPFVSNPLVGGYRDPVRNSKFKTNFAIFSKFKIIKDGLVKQDDFIAGAIFADIVKNNDTLRIYNFHLASLGIIPNEDYFGHDDSEKLIKRLKTSFELQQLQIDSLNSHISRCKYKVIMAGDMNNQAYSWAYKNLRNNYQDSFLEAGKGFGKTYEFKRFPLRIDYVFVDESINILQHKTYRQRYSDHYPIAAILEF